MLPQSEWLLNQESPDSVLIGAHEDDGCFWWTKIMLSDLPNGLFREEVVRALESAPETFERDRAMGVKEAGVNIVDEIMSERRRQISDEGWTPEHDDLENFNGQIASAASCYAIHAGSIAGGFKGYIEEPPIWWPWDRAWWKPKDARRDLIRAAALIVAEIERLDRRLA